MSEYDEEMNTITLMGDDGEEVTFEFLDLISYQGKEYVVLLPEEGAEDDDMVVIMEVVEIDEDTEEFHGIEDQETVDAIYAIFKDKFKDEFSFEE